MYLTITVGLLLWALFMRTKFRPIIKNIISMLFLAGTAFAAFGITVLSNKSGNHLLFTLFGLGSYLIIFGLLLIIIRSFYLLFYRTKKGQSRLADDETKPAKEKTVKKSKKQKEKRSKAKKSTKTLQERAANLGTKWQAQLTKCKEKQAENVKNKETKTKKAAETRKEKQLKNIEKTEPKQQSAHTPHYTHDYGDEAWNPENRSHTTNVTTPKPETLEKYNIPKRKRKR